MKIETVGLVGFGRFGRMVYRYLSPAVEMRVFDNDPTRLEGLTGATTLADVAKASLVVLAVPISSVEETCLRIAPLLRDDQIIADTCSVKLRPVEWMLRLLPPTVQILGTHPLFGPDSGKRGIQGLKIAICPARIEDDALQTICEFLSGLGLLVMQTTPEEHDRQIARSQAVFHLIAQALGKLKWSGAPISTPGPDTFFETAQSVQHDTRQLFLDIETQNPYAESCRRQFIQALIELDEELSRPDDPGTV